MSAQRQRRCAVVVQMLYKCFVVLLSYIEQTRQFDPRLVLCWAVVVDGGPALG